MARAIQSSAPTAVILDGRAYCERCQTDMAAAATALDAHVTPRSCFVWYKNTREGWQPIDGTGCAHYVAHQKNIRNGSPGQKCVAGFTFRVQPCLTGLTQVTGGLGAVQVGDIWVNVARTHTGSSRASFVRRPVRRRTRRPPPVSPTPRAGSTRSRQTCLPPTFTARATSSGDEVPAFKGELARHGWPVLGAERGDATAGLAASSRSDGQGRAV